MATVAVEEKVSLADIETSRSRFSSSDVVSIERLEDDLFMGLSEAERDLSTINDMIKNLCSFIDLATIDNRVVLTQVKAQDLVSSI